MSDNGQYDTGQESADRRCRARGHNHYRMVMTTQAPPNNIVMEPSSECTRCGKTPDTEGRYD